MWNLIHLLSSFFCLSLALQPGLEYRYLYSGRLATGVFEKRNQLAAVGMEMDVYVQVATDHKLTIKFDNIKVGTYHDDLICDLRRPIPFVYQSLAEGKEVLQTPFIVSLDGKDQSYLDVPAEEPVWVTNVRKAVVGVLPFRTLWEEMKNSKSGFPELHFGTEEELIGGRCMSWYTVMAIPDHDALINRDEKESNLEEDVQRGGPGSTTGDTNIPHLHDKLWTVTRAIDYEMCSKPVELILNGNKESEDLTSRTSMSRYVLRGDAQGLRMETAVVEGVISVFTGNGKSRFQIDTITNQTLKLRSVRVIQDRFSVDSSSNRRVHSWYYEGHSMRRPDEEYPGRYHHLEEKLLGIRVRGDNVEELKNKIFSSLEELSSVPNNLVTAMATATKMISYLSYEEIDSMYELLQEKVLSLDERGSRGTITPAQQNVIDFKRALVLAGTEPAINFLLDLLEDDVTRRSDDFVFFFFKQVATTLKAPSIIPRIVELATTMSWESREDIAKTLALTSAASLFGLEGKITYFKNSAVRDESCFVERKESNFISYLKEGIQNKSSEVWKRVIYVQSLINTGTTDTLEVLNTIIYGAEDEPAYLRTVAMAALSARHLPRSAKELVYNTLTPLMENTEERPPVREMAFLVMVSWQPRLSWWKRLALATWHEPSLHFSNLISMTIEGIASGNGEMKEMVSRVAYMAKPSSGVSLSLSSRFYLDNYIKTDWIKNDVSIVWFANLDGIIPTHIFVNYELQILRGFSTVTEDAMWHYNMDFFMELLKQYRDQYKYGDRPPDDESKVFDNTHDALMELGFNLRGFPMSAQWFLKHNNNFFFAKTVEFFGGGRIFGFIQEFSRYIPQVFDKVYYEKSLDTTNAYPTDLGIPFLVQYSSQNGFKITPGMQPMSHHSDFSGMRSQGSFNFTFNFNHETEIQAKTLVPWLRSSVASIIRNEVSVDLPVAGHYAVLMPSYQLLLKLTLPHRDVELITQSNNLYTALYESLLPPTSIEEEKRIIIPDGKEQTVNYKTKKWTGIWVESKYQGESETPEVYSILRSLTPSLANWNYKLIYDRKKSEIEEVTFSFTYASKYLREPEKPVNMGSFDHYSEVPEYTSSRGGQIQSEGMKQAKEVLQQIRQLQEQESGDIKTIGVTMKTSRSDDVNYKLFMMLIENDDIEMEDTKMKIISHYDIPPFTEGNTFMTCFDISYRRPSFLPLTQPKEILNMNLFSEFNVHIYNGKSCEAEDMVLNSKGSVEVSPSQKSLVRAKLEEGCDYNHDFPLKDIITSMTFDSGNLNINWTDKFPDYWKSFVHVVYDMIRATIPPQSTHYHDEHERNSINIDLQKYADRTMWHISAHLVLEYTEYTVSIPSFLITPASFGEVMTHRLVNGGNPGVCSIGSNMVHTFDGENFLFKPNKCWKVVALDASTNAFQIRVRHNSNWEAEVMWADRGLLFEIDSSTIRVNSKAPSKFSQTYQFVIRDNSVLLILNIGIAIKVSDKVEIDLPFSYRSYVVGLCGKYDGERQFEFLGPEGCDYNNQELFAATWELSGGTCDEVTHTDNKQKVEEYQKACPKSTYVPTGFLKEYDQIDCTKWEYQIRKEGQCNCTATMLTPICKPGCSSSSESQKQVQFNCIIAPEHMEKDAICSLQPYTVRYPSNCRRD